MPSHARTRRTPSSKVTADSSTNAGPPAFMSFERISPCTATASSGAATGGAPYTSVSRATRSPTGTASKSVRWNAIARWRSWSTTQSAGTPARAATSAVIVASSSGAATPAASNRARSSIVIRAARAMLAALAAASIREASGVGTRKGSMPLPHRYMRPGFAGSLMRASPGTPAWPSRSASSTVISSMPKSGTIPAAPAASATRR